MQKKEYPIETSDGKILYIRYWHPVNEPKAIMLMLHGFSEHSGRYIHWAEKFVNHNIIVYAIDCRGHGKAEGIRGHTPSYNRLLDDIDAGLSHIVNDNDLPLILYGQSLGGNLALGYGLFRNNELSGIISTSPWLKLVTRPKTFTIILGRLLRKIAPAPIRDSKLNINLLSHDPQVAIDYENDPLTHSSITPQLFFGTEKAARSILKNIQKIKIPLLLMHGTGDLVTSCKTSEKFASRAKNLNKDIVFIKWKDYFHELHNEIGNQKVFNSTMEWINSKILKAE